MEVRSLCGRKWLSNVAHVRSLCGRKSKISIKGPRVVEDGDACLAALTTWWPNSCVGRKKRKGQDSQHLIHNFICTTG
ncbi:hypothetical protein LshimejAT787_0311340 [Lyophyllum shimeji]|uniref:Uncharacterized protein n=1 Tax=Lyophyllum shimeji TaxID=47721 RepID=A0A9P3PIK7_LYOSH|nr:hypothetical protein LshimejAT787_0311340 [Lyophyllum shimeji]